MLKLLQKLPIALRMHINKQNKLHILFINTFWDLQFASSEAISQ